MTPHVLQQILAARSNRDAIALITDLKSGGQRVVPKAAADADPLCEILAKSFRLDQSLKHEDAFIRIYNPPLKLVIIGAVLLTQSLIPLAQGTGYHVTVVDPRSAFATQQRFPGITLHTAWPDEVLPTLSLDARTAVLALTHDPKIDDPALNAALHSEAFYIGALGSKKTQGARAARLTAQGFDAPSLSRIHGPVGLNIGAQGAAEIAVSIMAEMIAALRQGL